MDPGAPQVPPRHHAVQFYGDEQELSKTVAAFLIEGLVTNQPAVLITTPSHTSVVLEQLTAGQIDVDAARRLGDLIILDADEVLASFMDNGMPNPALFRRNLGAVLEQAVRGRERSPVRAYGEMVDVLWKRGATDAAIRLEVLWNELAAAFSFSLLCGYAMGNFYKQTAGLEQVASQHTHVIEPQSNVVSLKEWTSTRSKVRRAR